MTICPRKGINRPKKGFKSSLTDPMNLLEFLRGSRVIHQKVYYQESTGQLKAATPPKGPILVNCLFLIQAQGQREPSKDQRRFVSPMSFLPPPYTLKNVNEHNLVRVSCRSPQTLWFKIETVTSNRKDPVRNSQLQLSFTLHRQSAANISGLPYSRTRIQVQAHRVYLNLCPFWLRMELNLPNPQIFN